MKFNEEEAYKDLEKREVEALEQNDEIRQIISSSTKSYKVIKVANVEIRIRAFMPKAVRIRLLKAGNDLDKVKTENDMRKVEETVYDLVSSMCLDEPYTKKSTWKYLDEKTGAAQQAMVDIIEAVSVTDKQIETFRRKQ